MAVSELNIIEVYNQNKELFQFLQKEGRIDIFLIRNMEIFQNYKIMKEAGEKTMKIYYKLAIKHRLSTDMVRKIIKSFRD